MKALNALVSLSLWLGKALLELISVYSLQPLNVNCRLTSFGSL